MAPQIVRLEKGSLHGDDCLSCGEEDGIFEMDMAVQIFLQLAEAGEEGAIGIASVGGGLESMSQFAQAGECVPGTFVLVHHATDRFVQWHRWRFASADRDDGREEDFLFLHHMREHLFLEGAENIEDLDQRRGVSPVNLRDALGHRMQPGQLAIEISMMRLDDVGSEFGDGEIGGILHRGGFVRQFGFELLDDRFGRNVFPLAGFPQSARALATEIDSERLEDPGTAGAFRDEFADRAFEQWSAGWGEDIRFVTHFIGNVPKRPPKFKELPAIA